LSARNKISVVECIQAWLLCAVKRQLVVIAKLLAFFDSSFGNEHNVVLAVRNNKSRLAIWTATMVDITGDVPFFGRVDDKRAVQSEKVGRLQALGPVAHLSDVADARSQQLPGVSESAVIE
jgi:hypothetical protein